MTRARDVSNIDGILTTKGDIFAATAAATPDRLGVGTNGQVLTAASGQSTGLQWSTPSSPAFKGCSLQLTSSVGVSNGTQTVVDFTTELFDTDAFHDNSTNPSRITAPAGLAGKYLMIGSSGWANASSATDRGIRITKNGSVSGLPQVNWQTSASGVAYMNISTIVNLSVGDYCQVEVIQYNGGALVLQSATTFFQAIYLGA